VRKHGGPIAALRRHQAERRRYLTRREREAVWHVIGFQVWLCLTGSVMCLTGAEEARGIGTALLLLALVPAAMPIRSRLRARVHRREARADSREPLR